MRIMGRTVFGPPYPVLQQVSVATKTGRIFRGVLWARRGAYLVLRNAELIKAKGEVVAMAGDLAIDASNIDFMQVLG